jgi:hypothetical protein
MLQLHSLCGSKPLSLPYRPDMPLWQYLREVIAPTAGFRLENGKTVRERVLANGQCFDFENKHILLKDFVEDGGNLCYLLPLGPSRGTLVGNACPDGGDTSGCPICLEPSFNFSTSCLHRFHARCLVQMMRGAKKALACPLCRVPLTDDEETLLYFEARYETGDVPAKKRARNV